MGYKASNNADTTLSESITTTSTAINVATGHGDDFPALGATDWTLITITDKNGAREIIKIIARSGDTMTVGTTPGGEADVGGRAQEGTAALSITYTDDHSVRCGPTAGLIEAMADYSDQGDLTATTAEIEAVCNGNTATAAELSQLHESGVVKADLVKLHDTTSSAEELSQLHESGVVNADLAALHAASSTPTADTIAKFNSDGIMKGAELNMTGEVSATGTTRTTTLDLGTVTAGDRIQIEAYGRLSDGTPHYSTPIILLSKASGTASICFFNDPTITYLGSNGAFSDVGNLDGHVSATLYVTGSGTLVMKNIVSAVGNVVKNSIRAHFLKKS